MQRKTRQREAILQTIREAEGALTPRAVLTRAQAICPALGIATVYRSLKALVNEKHVVPVNVAGVTHYDYAGLKHHHHFVCRVCGLVFDLAECLPQVEKLAPPSFVVEAHEITLHGLCGACVGEARH
ncbi:MAG TPA: transcriptional repressor [Chthoniobacterales bacterium]